MTAPPVLTPERIDAMLSIIAEVCLESVVEAGQRQKMASDDEAFERCGRSLQTACRNLRQTIALKQKFDREEARKADDARRVADGLRVEAEREHRNAVARHSARVRRHYERVLWDEYEEDEAQALFDDVDDRLGDLAEDPDFLETPAETLIQRLADAIGLDEDEPDEPPAPEPAPPRSSSRMRGPRLTAPAEPAQVPPPDPPPAPEPPEPQAAPPEPPPPPPEPYIPPWERLRPGQYMPGGGTGW